ncbi:hypothetical protein L227DRAFT_109869 [Lentinus tigrinus ALCF2SS1-6]|uniref:Uncharacterized protein n=1 Tax=Lentinus tigrinus ALCF2SS1-6 TaxID=1328759 RepID=A0A5C2SFS7_9APHY|nr:hypothetical protein L227DRAFT_109869 [Lentinus tigrinus ALCF2SS1-6]
MTTPYISAFVHSSLVCTLVLLFRPWLIPAIVTLLHCTSLLSLWVGRFVHSLSLRFTLSSLAHITLTLLILIILQKYSVHSYRGLVVG